MDFIRDRNYSLKCVMTTTKKCVKCTLDLKSQSVKWLKLIINYQIKNLKSYRLKYDQTKTVSNYFRRKP